MAETFKWGVLAPGSIAHKFADGLKAIDGAVVHAVGSRDIGRANAFADKYNAPNRYGSYAELAADSEVDAIYVAVLNPFHYENVKLCLEAGTPVLCEKPFVINAAQAAELIDISQQKNVFLMEAMWTRFLPAVRRIKDWIAGGWIGDIRMVKADFAFRTEVDPEQRLFSPELGGGGLLDVGIYVTSFAYNILGAPDRVVSQCDIGRTGVDEHAAIIFGYDSGQLAVLTCGVRTQLSNGVYISGTEGSIKIPPMFFNTTTATLNTSKKGYPLQADETMNGESVVCEHPHDSTGFEYETREAMECINAGKHESSIMPLSETLSLMKTLDSIRAEWGLKYPFE